MTDPYDVNPMPARLAVACPACGCEAVYEPATVAPIRRRRNVPYFKRHKDFLYVRGRADAGGYRHLAVHFPGLAPGRLEALKAFPAEESAVAWAPVSDGWRHFFPVGSIACGTCGHRARHRLRWPQDAWFQAGYRGHVLWAWDRDSAGDLLAYVEAKDRRRRDYRHRLMLMKVPGRFLTAKARPQVAKQLRRRLRAK